MISKELLERRKRIISRLKERGISSFEIPHLPYLHLDDSSFATPHETGIRMIILYSCAIVANNPGEREKVQDWLVQENLWSQVSPKEKKLFEGEIADEELLNRFSWNIEAFYALAWALNITPILYPPIREIEESEFEEVQSKMPKVGDSTSTFLAGLNYRDKSEIFEENILNEIATTYFRDLMFNGEDDTTDINRLVSFERHVAFNWVRRFSDISDWDKTDTST